MDVAWPLLIAGLIGLLVAFKLVVLAVAAGQGGTPRPRLARALIAFGIWLVVTGANMIYILSLMWGYDPDLPPDWAMAMLGCGIALAIGYGLLRWTRAAREREPER
jgi:hypothetical protein